MSYMTSMTSYFPYNTIVNLLLINYYQTGNSCYGTC